MPRRIDTAERWIHRLGLEPHPEGGFFRETYRSSDQIPASVLPHHGGVRSASTAIYFLLKAGQLSRFHRIRSDELWHYHLGHPLRLHVIDPEGNCRALCLGREQFQLCVPAGSWFGAEVMSRSGFTLVSCTVSPGFDFADFELADREQLVARFPEHRKLITRFTR